MNTPTPAPRRRPVALLAAAWCLVAAVGATVSAPLQAQTPPQTAPLVRLTTDFGPIDIQLDSRAPATVANFMNYVRSGRFDSTVLHRLVPGFVVQGGGFRWVEPATPRAVPVTTDAPVVNEFSPLRSNLRSTVAMAKLGGDPNSATSQWFVNLADNAANLDTQNGGFTVFGRVTTPGMAVVDRIAALGRVNANGCALLGAAAGAMTDLPVRPPAPTTCEGVNAERVVLVRAATELPPRATASTADRIYDYLEALFPEFLAPANQPTQTAPGFTFRYYPGTNSYVGLLDGMLYYLAPASGSQLIPLVPEATALAIAQGNGY